MIARLRLRRLLREFALKMAIRAAEYALEEIRTYAA